MTRPEPALRPDAVKALDQVVDVAYRAGVSRERARISEFMRLPGADLNAALAVRLALSGEVTLAAAEEALAISILSNATPADEGDPASFN
jgi:hypothetical protein